MLLKVEILAKLAMMPDDIKKYTEKTFQLEHSFFKLLLNYLPYQAEIGHFTQRTLLGSPIWFRLLLESQDSIEGLSEQQSK